MDYICGTLYDEVIFSQHSGSVYQLQMLVSCMLCVCVTCDSKFWWIVCYWITIESSVYIVYRGIRCILFKAWLRTMDSIIQRTAIHNFLHLLPVSRIAYVLSLTREFWKEIWLLTMS